MGNDNGKWTMDNGKWEMTYFMPQKVEWLDTQISGSGAGKVARQAEMWQNATEMHDVLGTLFGAIRTCSGFGWLNNLLISY